MRALYENCTFAASKGKRMEERHQQERSSGADLSKGFSDATVPWPVLCADGPRHIGWLGRVVGTS